MFTALACYCLLIVSLLNAVSGQRPSPCPNILRYIPIMQGGDNWKAHITLTSDSDAEGVYVGVTLDRKVNLLTDTFGETATDDNMVYTIKSEDLKLAAGKSINITLQVFFYSTDIVPSIIKISLNGRIVCNDVDVITTLPPTTTKTTTTSTTTTALPIFTSRLKMKTTLPTTTPKGTTINAAEFLTNPIGVTTIPFSNPIVEIVKTQMIVSKETVSITAKQKDQPIIGLLQDDDYFFFGDLPTNGLDKQPSYLRAACGKPFAPFRQALVAGAEAGRGAWPWHAAIYTVNRLTHRYRCGGTLISDRFVITAAHCVVRTDTRATVPHRYLIYLGLHNINSIEHNSRAFITQNIIIHPEYDLPYFTNNVALVELNERVQFSDYIRPICIMRENTRNKVGESGTVVGWGYDRNFDISETLQMAEMPIVATDKCLSSDRRLFEQVTSANTFCAGFSNTSHVCNGDSGSGMYLKQSADEDEPTWYLGGVVSVSVALQRRFCDKNNYVVFSDVDRYYSWIDGAMNMNTTSQS